MVSKSDLTISFLLAFAFWMIGRVLGRWMGIGYDLFSFSTLDAAGFLVIGFVALFLSALFFGRTVFVAFFLLGLVIAPVLSVQTLFLNLLCGIAWALFGVLGAWLGKMVADELQGDGELELIQKGTVVLLLIGVVLSLGIGFEKNAINSYNAQAASVLADVRDGHIDFVTAIMRLAGADTTGADTNPNG
ncbi:MAG: hypothetical protein Q7R47_07080 [Candidatus Diapherotrites archaeon]|nr:hypothetical protein [Candidatus Diapherotrites archaeon]